MNNVKSFATPSVAILDRKYWFPLRLFTGLIPTHKESQNYWGLCNPKYHCIFPTLRCISRLNVCPFTYHCRICTVVRQCSTMYTVVLLAFRLLTYHLGILGFYRGFILSMITFGPQSMLFWHIFGSARESLSKYHYIKERQNAHIGKFPRVST